jgi:cysteine-rich repeat protein
VGGTAGTGGDGGSAGEGGSAGDAGNGGAAGDSGAAGVGGSAGTGGAGTGGTGGAGNGGASGSAGASGGGAGGGPLCSGPQECNDNNPCTADACDGGACKNPPDDTQLPLQLAGNCKAEVCSGGAATDQVDDKDLPTDDGEPCTVETCEGGVPGKTLLNDVACELGGKKGYCKAGACQIDCSGANECEDSNACTSNACTDGKCIFTPLANGIATPGASDPAGDCKKNTCQDGKPTEQADTGDLPTPDSECKTPLCTAGGPAFENKNDGTACTTGGQLCIGGACKANTCGDGFRLGNEECDKTDLNGKTCSDFGFGPGSSGLACDAFCKLISVGCQSVCGNGVQEPGEDCDDATSPGAAGNGCSKYCKAEPAVGELVVTEIMFNPDNNQTSAEDGEWFEVLNTSSKSIDIRGLQLASVTGAGNAELHTIAGETPLVVAPGARVVLAKSADPAKNNGIQVFYAYGSSITFRNSDEDFIEIKVASSSPLTIDKAGYTKTNSGSTQYKGASFSLAAGKETAILNDDPTNFCPGKPTFGSGATPDKGTPGAPNDSCP